MSGKGVGLGSRSGHGARRNYAAPWRYEGLARLKPIALERHLQAGQVCFRHEDSCHPFGNYVVIWRLDKWRRIGQELSPLLAAGSWPLLTFQARYDKLA
jgi:hypothetical protein